MRITGVIREAIIKGVMGDIPKVDYREEMRKIVDKEAMEALPEPIKKLLAAHPEYKAFLATTYVGNTGCYVFNAEYKPTARTLEKIKVLNAKFDKQRDERYELRKELEGLLSSFTTVKQFEEAMPEMVKYSPATIDRTKNLPVSKVLGDMMALGWKARK